MVNNRNISFYTKAPPPSHTNAERMIDGGPISDRSVMLKVIEERGENCFRAITEDCANDMMSEQIGDEEATELLREAIENGRYINSMWCRQNPGGPWAACDAYELTWREWDSKWYVKLCLGKTGQILLIVSCHPSKHQGGSK